jgi:hypothetical protein
MYQDAIRSEKLERLAKKSLRPRHMARHCGIR